MAFEHCEIDTAKGGTGKGTECLLTMAGRKNRIEIASNMPNALIETDIATLNGIETNMG